MAAILGTPELISVDVLTDNPAAINVTVPSGASGYYVMWTWYAAAGGGLLSATLNSVSPDQTFEVPAAAGDNVGTGVMVWYDPPSGTQSLDIAWDASPAEGPLVVGFGVENGDNTAWRDADGAQVPGGTQQTITLTTVSGDLVIAFDQSYTAVPSNESGWTSLLTVGPSLNEGGRLRSIVATGSSQSASTQDTNYSTIVGIVIPDAPGGVTMPVDSVDMALAGQDVTLTLTANVVLPVDFSTLQLSGQDVTLTATSNLTLTVDSGSLTFTGQEVPFQYINPADPGQLTFVGQDVTLVAQNSVTMTVDSSTLTLAGQEIPFIYINPADPGQLQFTGQDVTLTLSSGAIMPVDAGALTFAGQDVGLVASNSITLSVENAVLTLTGSDVNLVADIDVVMPVDFSLLQFIGQDVGLLAGNSVTMAVDSGSLTLSGQDVGLTGTANVVMTVTAPTLQFQGQNVQLDGGDPGITAPSSLRFVSYGKEFPYTTYFVKLGWQPSSRSFGTSVAYYKLYRNGTYTGVQIPHPGETGELYYFDRGLSKGTYTYRISAMDSNGIETAQSNEVTVIITTAQDTGWLGGQRWKHRQRIR